MATKTLNIALDEKLIVEIDQAVKKDFGSRSEYFRRLALHDLQKRHNWKELFDSGNSLGRKTGITTEEEVNKILDDYKSQKNT